MKSLSKSSKSGEGGGDGEGGVGSRGGRIPCFRRASLLKMIKHLNLFFQEVTHNSVSSLGFTDMVLVTVARNRLHATKS